MTSWRAVAILTALALPAPAAASVLWRGDYETGDWSQWSKAQAVADDRLRVVQSPVRQGRYALEVTVRQGDNPIGASGNRNELVYLSYEPAGTERWYRWQTMWPADYPSAAPWQIFTQWHHSGSDGSPPLVFSVRGETVRMLANTQVVWTTPLVRGVWHDFLFHVKWSPDAKVGFVELWYDGALVLPRTYTPTQFPGQTNYLKQGLYRDDTIAPTARILHDGMVAGETRADVEGPADAGLPGPDAGQPGPDAAQPGPDAARPGPDAAQPGPDAAAPPGEDAGAPALDAGADSAAPPDAGPSLAASPDASAVEVPDERGEPTYEPVLEDPGTGCAAAGTAPLLGVAAAGLALVLRRRRRRERSARPPL